MLHTTPAQKRRLLVQSAALLALAGLAAATSSGFGLIYNTENCLPRGWYVTTPVLGHLKIGQTVVLCPPARNPAIRFAVNRRWLIPQQHSFCPGNLTPYLKQVYALPGDRVNITPRAVRVNGRGIPHTASLATTLNGRTPMPHVRTGAFVVPPGQVLLLATHASNAFDGRYFGPVLQSDVPRRAFKLG